MMEEVLGKLSTLEVDMKGVQVKARFTFYKYMNYNSLSHREP